MPSPFPKISDWLSKNLFVFCIASPLSISFFSFLTVQLRNISGGAIVNHDSVLTTPFKGLQFRSSITIHQAYQFGYYPFTKLPLNFANIYAEV